LPNSETVRLKCVATEIAAQDRGVGALRAEVDPDDRYGGLPLWK
jgi:hypothetical protein